MKISNISFSEFCDSFSGSYEKNFSYEGKRALFDYLEDYEEQTGEEIELDAIALCCEYTEYKNLKELKRSYNDIKTIEDLEDKTMVIKINDDSFIIQDY